MSTWGQATACWCEVCEATVAAVRRAAFGEGYYRTFIVCPDCGNKRCPKATFHDHACSGSNRSGQPGSSYGGGVDPPALFVPG